jgi:hypothetical protein
VWLLAAREKRMNIPTSMEPEEKAFPVEAALETQLSKLAAQESRKLSTELESNVERISSSIARLTSSSIDDLQDLISELQKMQEFLKSEVDSVQCQIDNAMAGINIIVETIAPWKSILASQASQNGSRTVRGPAANLEGTQSRRMSG